MTADPPGTDHDAVASRLDALDDVTTAEHLAVYTTIAGDLAARLDQPDLRPDDRLNPDHGGARG